MKISEKTLAIYLKPLIKHDFIEAIYVYGSAVTKKSANDIDTMIILNDSGVPPGPEILKEIEKDCLEIEEKAKKQDILFHFQPLKMLSRWWYLVLENEPWISSSLRETIVIYDKKNIIGQVSKLIKSSSLYKKEEKAEKLIERSELYFIKNRQLLLNSLSTLSNAATEAAQILLLFDNKIILNKKRISYELETNYKKMIGEEMIGNYKEIIDLEEKMEKGALSEFSAENLDYYLDKTKKFIDKVESMLSKK
jgi:hypothetical protein